MKNAPLMPPVMLSGMTNDPRVSSSAPASLHVSTLNSSTCWRKASCSRSLSFSICASISGGMPSSSRSAQLTLMEMGLPSASSVVNEVKLPASKKSRRSLLWWTAYPIHTPSWEKRTAIATMIHGIQRRRSLNHSHPVSLRTSAITRPPPSRCP